MCFRSQFRLFERIKLAWVSTGWECSQSRQYILATIRNKITNPSIFLIHLDVQVNFRCTKYASQIAAQWWVRARATTLDDYEFHSDFQMNGKVNGGKAELITVIAMFRIICAHWCGTKCAIMERSTWNYDACAIFYSDNLELCNIQMFMVQKTMTCI